MGLEDPGPDPSPVADSGGSESPLDTGLPRRFSDYELLEEIARGGMGIVYRARQLSLDRIVAVKMLLLGHYANEEFIHRFRVEASAAASLRHPNIVPIHEVGVHGGQHYFAMDFIDGPNLAQFVRAKPVPAKHAATMVKTIAEAIELAHQRRILHRDLKPSNVLIDANGEPHITDFGLAKRLAAVAPAAPSDSAENTAFVGWDITVTGQMLGSPNYIPPEQASVQAGKIGPHSDVYAIGAILYHTLTARPPFVGETLAEVLHKVLNDDPIPPRLLNPTVPADLETLCLKCLEREVSRRYASAQLLADELGRFLRGEPILARPVTAVERAWRWCRRNPALSGTGSFALALLLVLGIGSPVVALRINQAREDEVVQHRRADGEARKARENLYAADIGGAHRAVEEGNLELARQLLSAHLPAPGEPDLRGFEWRYLYGRLSGDHSAMVASNVRPSRHLSVSPDGRLLAGGYQVWDITTRTLHSTLGNDAQALAFAPHDGSLLLQRGRLFARRNPATGSETILREGERVEAIRFSRTGRWMATGTARSLELWDTASWSLAASRTNAPFDRWPLLDARRGAFNFFAAKGLAFSPDERTLIVSSGYALDGLSELSAWTLPALEPRPMPPHAVRDAACVVFDPNGREFVTGNWAGDLRFWDAATLKEIPSRRIPDAHKSWISDMAFVPGTEKLVTAGADRCVRVWDLRRRRDAVTLRGHTQEINAMTVAADGRVFTDSEDRTLRQWTAERPSGVDRALAEFGSPLLPAGWCDGGNLLATVSEQSLHFWRIHEPILREDVPLRMELNGLGPLPLNWRRIEGMVAVSPNRRWLAVARPREPIVIVDLGANHARREVPGGVTPDQYVAFSPDSALMVVRRTAKIAVIFDTATWKEIASLEARVDVDPVYPFRFADHAPVLAVHGGNSVLIWDWMARRPLKPVPAKKDSQMIGFGISADASLVAMGYTDDTITLSDGRTGEQLTSIPSNLAGVEWVSFSADGRTLATASTRSVKLWNLATRRELFTLELESQVILMEFTPDGAGLLTAEMAGITRFWRAPLLEEIAPAEQRTPPQQARR